jgi:menaquinone-dependent protoporphyrinogen oxidase
MSNSVIIGYATRYGSTQEVAEAVASILREYGFMADLKPLRKIRTLEKYNSVVLGAPLFMFHWHKDALHFLSKYRKSLMKKSIAVFALGPVQDPHNEKEWKDSRAQLDKELSKFPWFKPADIKIFGGKFDPAKLHSLMKLFAGKVPPSDIRDWEAIRSWASDLASQLKPSLPE